MNARFTPSATEQATSPDGRRDDVLDDFVPGLLPSAGSEVPTAGLLESVPEADLSIAPDDDVFVPDHYEPNYAYPLVAWLTPAAGAAGHLPRLMRMISERNYFGVSIPITDPDGTEQQIFDTFLRLRRCYHLHTERVYLLGMGHLGTLALRTGLSQPGWFAGIAAIAARWPETPRLLSRFHELRGKRVLLSVGESDSAAIVSEALYTQQLLWSAGMHVTAFATSTGRDGDRSLLREIDRWIMQAVEQPEMVC